jgi:hypothetical protein
LAQGRLSLLLALEVAAIGRATADRHRTARIDPADEHGESALGRATHSRRTVKLGFEVAQSSVAKYMVKQRGPRCQGWRTFLRNHAPDIAAMDLFVVPTIGFDLLYAFVIVRLDRRDLFWINVTANPTAEWVARQGHPHRSRRRSSFFVVMVGGADVCSHGRLSSSINRQGGQLADHR